MIFNVIIFASFVNVFVETAAPFGAPENVTVTFLNSVSVKISWDTPLDNVEKYDVMYKPTEARIVAVVASNSNSVSLNNLMPNTQYQMSVTAIKAGKRYRSRPIVFRTLDSGIVDTNGSSAIVNDTSGTNIFGFENPEVTGGNPNPIPPPPYDPHHFSTQHIEIRGIEVIIVVLVLLVWIGAIVLFFNRWGKIRMLLPYQPDFKETQLKVPGTSACAQATSCPSQNGEGGEGCCSQRDVTGEHHNLLLPWRHSSPADLHDIQLRSIPSCCEHNHYCCERFYNTLQAHARKARSADSIMLNYGCCHQISTEEQQQVYHQIPTEEQQQGCHQLHTVEVQQFHHQIPTQEQHQGYHEIPTEEEEQGHTEDKHQGRTKQGYHQIPTEEEEEEEEQGSIEDKHLGRMKHGYHQIPTGDEKQEPKEDEHHNRMKQYWNTRNKIPTVSISLASDSDKEEP